MSRFLYFLFLCVISIHAVRAQDPSFSQYKFNKLYFNSAYAGYNEQHHASATYRNLWPTVSIGAGTLSNYQIAADFYVRETGSVKDKDHMFTLGLGAFCHQNIEGRGHLTTTSFGGVIGQHFPISIKGKELPIIVMSFAAKGYANQTRINWDKLIYTDQLDIDYGIIPNAGSGQTGITKRWSGDLDAGLVVIHNHNGEDNWINEFGFSVAHLIASSPALSMLDNFPKTPLKIGASYRTKFCVKPKTKQLYLALTLLFEKQAKFSELNTSMDIYICRPKANVILSGGHRASIIQLREKKDYVRAFIGSIGAELNPHGKISCYIAYSCDIPYSGLSIQTRLAHEISIGINIAKRTIRESVDCPVRGF